MITSAHAKDNGAYTEYQQQHHSNQVYEPAAFDPSDGELTNPEICAYALIAVFALVIVWRLFKGDKS
jgi:hypothetical protein